MSASVAPVTARKFRCPASARWLPGVLAATMVLAAAILAARIDPAGRIPNSRVMRGLLLAAAAVMGVRIALSLSDLRLAVEVRGRDLLLELRGRMASISWEDILRLDWDPPFRHYGRWSPALVVIDRQSRRFRIPALVADGASLVSDVLECAGRSDLSEWASAHRLAAKMGRGRWWAAAGYVVAACAIVLAATAPLR